MVSVGQLTYGTRVLTGLLPSAAERQGRVLPVRLPETPSPIDVDRTFREAAAGLEAALARHPSDPVTVGLDDHTRPNVHTRLLLPRLLAFLRKRGVDRGRIRLIVAGGTHRPPRRDELPAILGEATWRAYGDLVEAHDCDRAVAGLGLLEDGTPVELNATAAGAGVHIALTDLDYHYFAGIAGGPKQLMPGLAGRAVITAEHLRMFGPLGLADGVDIGVIDGNPVYEYKRKVLAVIRSHFDAMGHDLYGLTSVVSPKGELVFLAGGDVEATHRAAIPVLEAAYTAWMPAPADAVLQGARQYGVNLYQTGKAFNAARRAVRSGGRILVAAPLSDGWGNDEFARLTRLVAPSLASARQRVSTGRDPVAESATIDQMLTEVQRDVVADFRIGKQKPIDLLLTLRHVGLDRLFLVSDGVPAEDQASLPIVFLGDNGEDPARRVRDWSSAIDSEGPTYAVIDDPALLVRVPA